MINPVCLFYMNAGKGSPKVGRQYGSAWKGGRNMDGKLKF